ncbi:uncharacterized protein N7496_004999 [Penicillium cataractarum]|uniref:Uncharacterized protein n=1 Tax=Penicillium cataractarum TaxID=2100454 RepID=A0A9W9VFH7_9EURO|nr:uncharacterized protein N7496_004999 [Penicillium cataractarum]KAJ5377590.1 hypothetical protein N7496_004999 [Penicillium cataractarum]
MADAELAKPVDWPPCSDEERQRIESQTRMVTQAKFGYLCLYRYASASEVAAMILCSLCAVGAGVVMPLMSIVFGNLSSSFVGIESQPVDFADYQHLLNRYTLYFVYLGIASLATVTASTFGFSYLGFRLTCKIRQAYFVSVLRQNIAFYDHTGAGEIAARMTVNINTIQEGVSEKVGLTLTGLATFVTALIIAFLRSWRLALVLLSVAQALETSSAGSTIAQEAMSSMRVISALGAQSHFEKQFTSSMAASDRFELKWRATLGVLVALMMFIMVTQYALAFWKGHQFLENGETTISRLLTTIMASMIAGASFGHILPHLGSFGAAAEASGKVFSLIDRESPIDPGSMQGRQPSQIDGTITFEDITHWYPSSMEGPPVLNHFSLHIPAGKTTAVVGASGSGKSTLVALLMRFYLPAKGAILVGGNDIEQLNVRWWRQQVALVSQEPVLFSASIFDNIAYGLKEGEIGELDRESRRQRVIEAATAANAHDFICHLPQGYDTVAGEGGMLLSGGQKQRIAIARALISNPRILLLDEATAALDSISELSVQSALDKAAHGRTTVVIAHRLSTIRKADHIVVMAAGQIAEQGSHDELLGQRGMYFSMVQAQQLQEAQSQEHAEPDPVPVALLGIEESKTIDGSRMSILDKPTSIMEKQAVDEMDSNQAMRSQGLLSFVWSMSMPELYITLGGFVSAAFAGCVYPVLGIMFGNVVFALTPTSRGGSTSTVNFWAGMLFMLGMLALVLYTLQGVAFAITAARLISRSRSRAFAAVLRQDIPFFDGNEETSGALVSFVTTDIQAIAGISGATQGAVVNFVWTIIASIVIACSFGWKLALVCTSTMPLLVFCGFLRTWILTRLERRTRRGTSASVLACEAINAIRTVAALAREEALSQSYRESLLRQEPKYLRDLLQSAFLYALSQSLSLFAMGLAFWYGGTLISHGEYTVKQFFICFVSVIWGSQAAAGIFSFANEIGCARQATERLQDLLSRTPPIDSWSSTGLQEEIKGDIELHDVHFRYPGRPEQPVLRGVTLKAKRGQFVAIVGASGSGKSSIFALLERFYDLDSGTVAVDGSPVSQYHLQHYRRQIGLVSQNTVLFSGTIWDNIVAGLDNVNRDEVIQACKDANIYDFIISLPENFSTFVGSKGSLLSGGQRQRLAIARALLRRPKILLLDEATSALDSQTELAVQAAIDRAAHGRTTIAIAHRLSTIQNANWIYVLDGGRVVERGTHTELMRTRGRYWHLAQATATSS